MATIRNLRKTHRAYNRNREKLLTLRMFDQIFKEEMETLYEFLCDGEDCSYLVTNELPLANDCPSLPEDYWRRYDVYRPTSSKVNYLRWFMESIKPSEVRLKNLTWVINKYTLVAAMIAGKPFCIELFFANNGGLLLGRYVIALENELKRRGIEFKNYCGLTEKGWETFLYRKNFNTRNAHGFYNVAS